MSLLDVILKAIDEKKGNDVKVIDFKNEHAMVDQFVITDAASQRQMWAIIDHIKEEVEKAGHPVLKVEGESESRWILIDCGDVVVHVFDSEERQVYKLEKLWADYLK